MLSVIFLVKRMQMARKFLLLILFSVTVHAESTEVGEALGLLIEHQTSLALTAHSYDKSAHITALMGVHELLEKGEIDKAKEMLQLFTLIEARTMHQSIEETKELPLAQNAYIQNINRHRQYIIKASDYLTSESAKDDWFLKETLDYINANNPIQEIPEEIINSRKSKVNKASKTLLEHYEELHGKI